MRLPDLVEARADAMMGKPCLRGTRIPVLLILEKLAAGETSEIILAAYPQLGLEHIKACLEYAAKLSVEGKDTALPPQDWLTDQEPEK